MTHLLILSTPRVSFRAILSFWLVDETKKHLSNYSNVRPIGLIDCGRARAQVNSKDAQSEVCARTTVSRYSRGGCMRPKRRRAAERAACYCCSKSLVIANEAVNYGRHVTARPGRAPTFQFIASLAQRLSHSRTYPLGNFSHAACRDNDTNRIKTPSIYMSDLHFHESS